MRRKKQRMERRRKQSVPFEDVPAELRAPLPPDASNELRQRQRDWFEAAGLSFADYCSWLLAKLDEARGGKRPPSRRRHVSAKELRELDAEREREGSQW